MILHRPLAVFAASVFVTSALSTTACADRFTLPFFVDEGGTPVVRVEFVEPDGSALFVSAVIDSANGDGIAFSPSVASRLGLKPTGQTQLQTPGGMAAVFTADLGAEHEGHTTDTRTHQVSRNTQFRSQEGDLSRRARLTTRLCSVKRSCKCGVLTPSTMTAT